MMSNRAPSLKTSSFRFYVLILLVNSCLLLFYIVYVVNYSTSLQLLPVPSNQFYVELNEKDLGRIERNLRLYRRKQFERIQRNRNESRLRRAVSHIDYDWWHKSNNQLPYFFANGSIRPNDHDKRYHRLAIWPDQVDHDRILNQLMYVPINYSSVLKSKRMKRIYIHNPNHSFNIRDVPSGRKRFLIDRCPVNTCEIVRNRYEAHLADAIVFKVILFDTC